MAPFPAGWISMNPRHIEGAWRHGWTLDVHTTSSVFLGHDENGQAEFDTTRSELGELVYQLKYHNHSESATQIAQIMATFLREKPLALSRMDVIIAVPASTQRRVQPVNLIASKLASLLRKPYSANAVRKTKKTPTLKNITDLEERRELLDSAFEGDKAQIKGKGVLIVDDLYRSGSTANAVTLAIIASGALRVYFLAATRTRSNI